MMILRYILDRLTEPSTWMGIFLFLSGVGRMVSPDLADLITSAGIAIAGLIAFLFPDTASR